MNSKGTTLIEIMITVAIFLVVVLVLISVIISLNSSFINIFHTYETEIDSCIAARAIAQELKNTSRNRITIEIDTPFTGSDQLTLVHPIMIDLDSDGITDVPQIVNGAVQWEATDTVIGLAPNDSTRLIKERGGVVTVLARNVKTVQFYNIDTDPDLAWDEVRIILELSSTNVMGRTYQADTNIIVNMRNTE